MARQIFPVPSPNTERLSRLVKTAVQGRSKKTTILGIIKREGLRFGTKIIDAIINFWRQTFSKAKQATSSKKDDRLVDYTVEGLCRRPKVIRVGYTTEFYDPNLDEMRPFGGYMDFDILTSVETAKQKILAHLADTAIQYYEYDKVDKKLLNQWYASLEFQTILCVDK